MRGRVGAAGQARSYLSLKRDGPSSLGEREHPCRSAGCAAAPRPDLREVLHTLARVPDGFPESLNLWRPPRN